MRAYKVEKLFSSERRDDDSPEANRILSIILLLPEPLGPDIRVNPSKKGILTYLQTT
jgi:hypothetical protein